MIRIRKRPSLKESGNMIKHTVIRKTGQKGKPLHSFGPAAAREALAFHRTLPGYSPTPLASLRGLAGALGLKSLYVKDESARFGLNSFKSLGGSYAMQKLLSEDPARQTFVTATDGNHGRGVAWAARTLGRQAVVYMPRGTAPERLDNILRLGAQAEITEYEYDDCVRLALAMSRENGWTLIQDTAWEGYERIPALIMQGYTTMGLEITEQLNGIRPTHIFLQAGVGSMAGALTDFFAGFYPDEKPVITIVEPTGAACFYETALANDGKRHFVRDMHTIMAGLCCGEPCTIAWDIISRFADHAIACEDKAAADGMRILGNPLPGDRRIISGESGAASLGAIAELMTEENCRDIRERIGLNSDSVVLCISTEGDTDRQNYRNIVWYGAYGRL